MRRLGLLSSVVVLAFAASAHAANTCTATKSGNWSDPTVWSGCGGGTPTSADTVDLGASNFGIVLDVSPTVAALTVASATLSGAHTLTVTGTFSKTGSGDTAVLSLGTPAILELDGGGTITAGGIAGNGTLVLGSDLTVAATASPVPFSGFSSTLVVGSGKTLTFQRDAIVQQAVDDEGTVTIAAGKTVTFENNSPGAAAENGGYSIGAGATLDMGATIKVGGAISGVGGTLKVSGGQLTTTGAVDVATADVHGEWVVDGATPLTVPTLDLNGGILSANRALTATTLDVVSGTLNDTATLTVPAGGTFTKTGTDSDQLSIGKGTLDLRTPATLTGGGIAVSGNGTLQLDADFTVASTASAVPFAGFSGLTVVASGTTLSVQRDAEVQNALDNEGTVAVAAGKTLTLAQNSSGAEDGSYSIGAGGTLATGALDLVNGAISGPAGTLAVTGGQLTTAGAVDVATITVHGEWVVDGATPLTVPTLDLDGGILSANRALTATTLDVVSGTLNDTATLTVPAGGTFTKTGTDSDQLSIGKGTLDLRTPATLTGGAFSISGNGTLQLDADFTVASTASAVPFAGFFGGVDVGAGTTLSFDRDATVQSVVRVAGTLPFAANQTLTANRIDVTGGLVSLASGAKDPGGAVNVNAGQLTLAAGSVTGDVTLTGGVVSGVGATGDLTNNGGTIRPGGSGAAGVLTVGGNYSQSAGTLEVDVTGRAPGDFDVLDVSGQGFSPGGTLKVVTSGFSPTATDTFQVVASPSHANGTFALDGGGVPYSADYDGPQNGVLLRVQAIPFTPQTPVITGPAQVGGALHCDPGNWGQGVTFTFSWLRDGTGTPVGSGADYTVAAADAGHQLVCHVSGVNAQSQSAARDSAAVSIPAPAATPTPTTTPTPTPTPTPTATPTPTPTPTPAPPPTAAEQQLAQAPASQVATAFGLPAARRCLSRRSFVIRLHAPAHVRIAAARVSINGRALKVRRSGGRFVARVDLRGIPKTIVAVRIQITTASGLRITGARTYHTCVPGRRR